jgi:hypothetical protein
MPGKSNLLVVPSLALEPLAPVMRPVHYDISSLKMKMRERRPESDPFVAQLRKMEVCNIYIPGKV